MSARATALAAALIAVGLTIAQDGLPAREWYHGWQYATVLAIAIAVMVSYAWSARGGADGAAGRRVAVGLAGAVAVAAAGLLSGLIGPDTVTLIGTPGTVMPVPDLGVAAFFAGADPQTIERGDATVTLRRRGRPAVGVGPRPLPLGLSVLFTERRPAAYVIARDEHGNRLTVTQPNNTSFLSPVMLFRQRQKIAGKTLPMDTFAVPALRRVVRILYFSAAEMTGLRNRFPDAPDAPGAVLALTDDAGVQQGITMAVSGRAVDVAGLRLTIALGTYPVLKIASAPQPLVVVAGTVLFLLGCGWALFPARRRVPAGEIRPAAGQGVAGQ